MSALHYPEIAPELLAYVEEHILPQYDHFDAAHQRDHAETVIAQSMALSRHYSLKPALVFVAAACHDLGLCEGREHHHEVSARIIRNDRHLAQWFSPEEVETIAEAAEDHRASAKREPRSLLGRIIAEADRLIDTDTTLRRTLQYGLSHYPELDKEAQYERMVQHLRRKYAEGGYLRLWIPESENAERLKHLRGVIADAVQLRHRFEQMYAEETADHRSPRP